MSPELLLLGFRPLPRERDQWWDQPVVWRLLLRLLLLLELLMLQLLMLTVHEGMVRPCAGLRVLELTLRRKRRRGHGRLILGLNLAGLRRSIHGAASLRFAGGEALRRRRLRSSVCDLSTERVDLWRCHLSRHHRVRMLAWEILHAGP